jgi:hypothetical protein
VTIKGYAVTAFKILKIVAGTLGENRFNLSG